MLIVAALLASLVSAERTPPPRTTAAHAWEPSIAALTDQRPAVYGPAIDTLIAFGPQILPDLTVLADDADPRVRGRVVTVVAGVGGADACAIAQRLSHDQDAGVRELAASGLGKLPLPGAYERLADLVARDGQPTVRAAAAGGLGELGDPRGLADRARFAEEKERPVAAAMREALFALAVRPAAVPQLAKLLATSSGDELRALAEAAGVVGDPRLSSALAAVLANPDTGAATLAARSLGADGDSFALEALCRAAAAKNAALAAAAADSLRRLTGYEAGPGEAWTLWWRDHAGEVAPLAERDRFLAEMHDPDASIDRGRLARFGCAELMPLVDGALGLGAPWWPQRAWRILAADDPARWTRPLAARIRSTNDPNLRLALIVLLDQLGDPGAAKELRELSERVEREEAQRRKEGIKPGNQAERLAIQVALERRKAGAVDPRR